MGFSVRGMGGKRMRGRGYGGKEECVKGGWVRKRWVGGTINIIQL